MHSHFDLDKYLPTSMRGKYRPKQIHILKTGYVRMELTAGYRKLIESSEDFKLLSKDSADALYEMLQKSPNVMEVQPKQSDLAQLSGSFSCNRGSLIFLKSLQLRIALSEKQRQEHGRMHRIPEQFWIWFDGGLYIAVGEVNTLPVPSDIGQAARDFIQECAISSQSWNCIKGIAPTPIHPDFYLVEVEAQEDAKLAEHQLLPVRLGNDDLVVLYPSGTALNAAVNQFCSDVLFGLLSFYSARITSHDIDDQLDKIVELNNRLSGLLAELFDNNALMAMMKRIARQTRRLLSHLHINFQELSKLELALNSNIKEMDSIIERSIVLEPIAPYLNKYASEHAAIDKESQLKLMDYAASEALNVGVIQATIWASVIGALMGSLMTLLFA